MIGLLVLPFLLVQQPTVLHPRWSVTARVICRIRKLSLLHPHALRFWLQLWLRLTCKTKPGLVLLLQSLKSSSLACVQTSPPPSGNIGRGDVIFPEGGGTSVNRLLKPAFQFRKTRAEAFFSGKKCKQYWRVLASQFRSSDQQKSTKLTSKESSCKTLKQGQETFFSAALINVYFRLRPFIA